MPERLIDCHSHIGKDFFSAKAGAKKEQTALTLVKRMSKCGVAKSIVFGCSSVKELVCPSMACKMQNKPPRAVSVGHGSYTLECPGCRKRWSVRTAPYAGVNARVVSAAAKYRQLVPFAILDPRHPLTAREAQKLASKGLICGIKLHPLAIQYEVEQLEGSEILQLARAARIPIIFHTGDDSFSDPARIARFAKGHRTVNFILSHCARLNSGALEIIKRVPNIWLETSLITRLAAKHSTPVEVYKRLIKEIGSGKILFGSDTPYASPNEFEGALEALANLDCNERDRWLIQHGNAERVVDIG